MSAERREQVVVLGAGVVGLTAAHVLASRGAQVHVVASHGGLEGSSGAAGAVWFPYGPEFAPQQERVNGWARETHRWLSGLARGDAAAGVDAVLPTWYSADSTERPVWADALPEEVEFRWVELAGLPAVLRACGQTVPLGAWCFRAPVIHPPRHLAWLEGQLEQAVVRRTVTSLDELDADVVVNCTGCGAAELARDDEMAPRLGQTVIATDGKLPRDCVLVDDRDDDAIFYSIARGPGGTEVVLGGCDLEDQPDDAAEEASAEVTRAILERHAACGIVARAPFVEKVGWRPGRRSGPRVEREGRVVHAYGHGGAGFTLAYGCAKTVAELVLC